jgi:hypothetical protein
MFSFSQDESSMPGNGLSFLESSDDDEDLLLNSGSSCAVKTEQGPSPPTALAREADVGALRTLRTLRTLPAAQSLSQAKTDIDVHSKQDQNRQRRNDKEEGKGCRQHPNSSDDGDDDVLEVLEVLPAASHRATANPTASSSGRSPRLSSSGQSQSDPVDLIDLASPSPLPSLRQRLAKRQVKEEASPPAAPAWDSPFSPFTPRPPVCTASNHLAHMDVAEAGSSAAASPHSSLTTTNQDEDDKVSDKRPAVDTANAVPSSQFSILTSDSESDDSFTQRCTAFRKGLDKKRGRDDEEDTKPPAVASQAPLPVKAAPANGAQKGKTQETKQLTKKAKLASKEARERDRLERKAAKEQEIRDKQIAKAERERERISAKARKEAQKEERQEQRSKMKQVRGDFANQEIVVLAEPSILDASTNSWKIQESLASRNFEHVHAYPSCLSCHALQFVRQDYFSGGATKAVEAVFKMGPSDDMQAVGFEHIPLLAIVVEAQAFIDLLQKPQDEGDLTPSSGPTTFEDDDDYPLLEEWLFGLVAGWRAAWRKTTDFRPRIILLLDKVKETLDNIWVQYNRKGRPGPVPPNSEQLHDAILWMLIQFQVESIHCSTTEDVAHEVYKLTRALADRPYTKQATDLRATAKLPMTVADTAPNLDRARDTWIRKLQQIPRVSYDMAHAVSCHYPTASSLWKVYQDVNIPHEEKEVLLAELFGTRSSQTKLSRHVYRALTSEDPAEILS